MKFDWKNWNVGGKIIFITTCVSVFSMFLKWIDIGIKSETGFEQEAFFLLALYIYPNIMLFKNQKIKRTLGLSFAIINIILCIWYYQSNALLIFGTEVNTTATGAYIYYISSIIFLIGILKYLPHTEQIADKFENSTNNKEQL